jgi:L-asparaginase/Glu-tRNA(Gln) amidotransferase subunit D
MDQPRTLPPRLQEGTGGPLRLDRWLWGADDDSKDKGLLIINTGGTFSSGNADSSKGWGPSNHPPGFSIGREIENFLRTHGLVWDVDPDVAAAEQTFDAVPHEKVLSGYFDTGVWNFEIGDLMRQFLKKRGVEEVKTRHAVVGEMEKGFKSQSDNGNAELAKWIDVLVGAKDELLTLWKQNAQNRHVVEYLSKIKRERCCASSYPLTLGLKVTVESLPETIDSSDCKPEKWAELAQAIINGRDRGFSGFVVIHGTDTLSYTAAALSFVLADFDFPIVITGSQVPWVKKGVSCDAQNNLVGAVLAAAWRFGTVPKGDFRDAANSHFRAAVESAKVARASKGRLMYIEQCLSSMSEGDFKEHPLRIIPSRTPLRGVYVFFDNKLMFGSRVVKASSTSFDAFTSGNALILGSKGGGGELQIAVKTFVEREIADMCQKSNDGIPVSFCAPRYVPPVQVVDSWCVVQIVKLYPGMSLDCINLARTIGIVFITFGTGNGPCFGKELADIAKRIPLVYVSECLAGGTSDTYATSFKSANGGVIYRLHDATVEAAYAKLSCVLSSFHKDLNRGPNLPSFPESALEKIAAAMMVVTAAEFDIEGYEASSAKARMNF